MERHAVISGRYVFSVNAGMSLPIRRAATTHGRLLRECGDEPDGEVKMKYLKQSSP